LFKYTKYYEFEKFFIFSSIGLFKIASLLMPVIFLLRGNKKFLEIDYPRTAIGEFIRLNRQLKIRIKIWIFYKTSMKYIKKTT